jgi:porin
LFCGRLGFRVESRRRLWSNVVPQSLSGEIGAGVPTGIGFGEFDLSLAELWWEQVFIKDRFSLRVGKQLPFGYFDFSPFKNPKTAFTNAAFALNPSIAWPQFGLGISTEIRPREDIYILAGLHDANGNPARSGFDTFFDEREYFTIAEIGWDPGYLENGKKNPRAPDYHATIWHTDARTALERPEGWGAGFTAIQPFGNLVAFGRYGYSSGGAALLKQLVMGGVAYNGAFGWAQDTVGFALGVGKPSASGLDTQFTSELYSRMQITKRLSLTPSIQLIANPSSNPERNLLAILGLRARVTW